MPDDYLFVCHAADIPNGGRRAIEMAGERILVFNINRRFYAIRNRCTHLDFPLDDGRQIGTEIICRQHGARFDILSGKVLGGPAVHNLGTFPVRVVDGRIEIEIHGT